jgi:nucleoside-diphosphate-sugar epimerase
MGHFNIIWQGDANAWALAAMAHSETPPAVLNVTGPETLSVREVCEAMGRMMDRPVKFAGTESGTALLNNAAKAQSLFGAPRVRASLLVEWVARWVSQGGVTLDKPTHFEARDGAF